MIPARLLLLCLSSIALLDAGDGTTFHGDSRRTGVYDAPAIRERPVLHWKFASRGPVLTSPAVTADAVFFGSGDMNFYAVDRRTGVLKWKFATHGPVHSSAAVASGTVFFGSFDGFFYALDAATGKLNWKFRTEGERKFEAPGLHGLEPAHQTMPDPYDFFLSSPLVEAGTVYFGSGDGKVYALDSATGAVRWKFATKGVVHASPTLADGVLFIGSWDTYLYALDAATGAERWRFKTGDDAETHNQTGIQGSAAVAGGVVYFGCRDNFVYALDAGTGKEKWRFPNNKSWVIATPAIAAGNIYFGTSDSRKFHALDIATGKPRFSLPTRTYSFSSPAISGDTAYFGLFDGRLWGVDIQQGTLLWEFETDGRKRNQTQLYEADGTLRTSELNMVPYYEEQLVQLYRLLSMGSVYSSPVPSGGKIYFGSTDGGLYAIGGAGRKGGNGEPPLSH
ncbi:MAG: PQQ-binding-like beta-propeller repeat protein [Acidobacteria bacterium]|nr:PQQ-binding-like beta-propeller repeat protein [Acidobacteriota bacterium]